MKNSVLKPFIILGAVLGGLCLFCLLMTTVLPMILNGGTSDSPVVSIEAENDMIYLQSDEIAAEDFIVYEVHENGKKSKTTDFKISRKTLLPYGSKTRVTVTSGEFSCDVDVTTEREKVIAFHCGYPNESDVKAVLYSNGELCFEGKGDTLQFNPNEFPWMDYEGMDEYPICSVIFQDTVTPSSLDNWFEMTDTLVYVGEIPSSVQSMENTFYRCESLKKGADWSKCKDLKNITSCYEDCYGIEEIPAIPSGVVVANRAFLGCTNMQAAPDLSKATKLVSAQEMFSECEKLVTASMAPNLEDMYAMYRNCINLQETPDFPDTIIYIDNAYSGDFSLKKASPIPKSVKSLSGCFSDCRLLSGTLEVNATADNPGSFLADAAVATGLNLTGSSPILNMLADSCEDPSIMVNGKKVSSEN